MTSPQRYSALAGKVQPKLTQSIARNSDASKGHVTCKTGLPVGKIDKFAFFSGPAQSVFLPRNFTGYKEPAEA